jgi:hypothetical protein
MSYEDCYIYLDLTKDLLKKKDLIKYIKFYIEEKNKINIKGHYGILIFQEEGNPVFITDKKDSSIITKAIEENWKSRAKTTSYFENGLFYVFGYIAETTRKKSKFNRVIVITDTPSDLNEEYQEALFNLVTKIKHFPTFIDIIRLTEQETRFQKDDVKLNILASDTKGGIFYVKDKKEFSSIIKKLIKSKQIVSLFADRPDEMKISSEDYAFYNNLAKKLIKGNFQQKLDCEICQKEVCPVCSKDTDIPMICNDCKTAYHLCCITEHTINHNIGIPHIFRCPKCDVLLKIDQNLIVGTEDLENVSVEEYISEETPELVNADEAKAPIPNVPDIPSTHQPTIQSESPAIESDSSDGEEKIIRVGGFFGKVYTVKKEGGKLVYSRTSEPGKKPKLKITICPECGENIPSESSFCPRCGSKIL